MKTFIFIPDTNKNAGLGHLYICFKYSNFVKQKYEIIFLINKKFNKRYMIKKNSNNVKIKYFFFSKIEHSLNLLKIKYNYIVTFVDTYNSEIRNINFKKFSKKHITILDFKAKCKTDYLIDHTFYRKFNYHLSNKKTTINVGLQNFPVSYKLKFSKRNLILINFGSIKNKNLIYKSLKLIKNFDLNKNYKVIIINPYFSKKDFIDIKLKNKIFCIKFIRNIENLYKKTYFIIGACGISLYESCFFNIPSIAKSVAKNQSTNFKNFYSKKCILDFNKLTKLSLEKIKKNDSYHEEIRKVEINIKKYFDSNINKKHLGKLFGNF